MILRMVLLFLMTTYVAVAQIAEKNMVLNGSFEEYHICPSSSQFWRGNIHYSKYWCNLRIHSPDYFNACASPSNNCPTCSYFGIPYAMWDYQYARTGKAMSGILLWTYSFPYKYLQNSREYITGQLDKPLLTGDTYCFEMYCNRANNKSMISQSHSIGVWFSTYLMYDTIDPNNFDTIGKIPQVSNTTVLIEDTLGWTKIAQKFIATDTFRYFTIGNFEPDATTWFTIYDTSSFYNHSYIYIDDVAVYKGKCREEDKPQKTFFNLNPNPGSGVFSLNYGVAQDAQLVVYDILGRTVLKETLAADKVLHHFSMQQYSNGMYFLKVLGANNDEELYSQKFLLQR